MNQSIITSDAGNYLFRERQVATSNFFSKVINNPSLFTSQLGHDLNIFNQSADISPYYLFTDVIYKRPEGKAEAQASTIFYELENKLDENYSHILMLDIFGRIIRTFALRDNKNFFDLLLKFSIVDSGKTSKILVAPPFNTLNVDNELLTSDSLGFRTIYSSQQQPTDSKLFTIVIVGGSFAASVYSICGESFAERLECNLNSNPSREYNYRVINLSMGGCLQGDNFSHIVHSGLYETIDLVVWIDGLNDICCGMCSSDAVDMNLPAMMNIGQDPFTPKIKDFRRDMRATMDTYLAQRNTYLQILRSSGINVINILQPICDIQSKDSFTARARYLLKFYEQGWSIYDMYSSFSEYLSIMAPSKYSFELYSAPSSLGLEFWDVCHLSPDGEAIFGEWLYETLISLGLLNRD